MGDALADQWHVLPPGVPNLVVYTAFFYFSTMFFCECMLLHLYYMCSITLPFHSAGATESLSASQPLLMCCMTDSSQINAHSAAPAFDHVKVRLCACAVLSFTLNLTFLYKPILGAPKSSITAYLKDWGVNRLIAFCAGIICGLGNTFQFMGGQARYSHLTVCEAQGCKQRTHAAVHYLTPRLLLNLF